MQVQRVEATLQTRSKARSELQARGETHGCWCSGRASRS